MLNASTRWVLGTASATAYGTDGVGGASATQTAGELTVLRPDMDLSSVTWTESSKTITKTGAFVEYTFRAGDRLTVFSGTGAVAGSYLIASRTSANAIVLQAGGVATTGSTDLVVRLQPVRAAGFGPPVVELLGYNVSVVAAGLMQCVDGRGNVIPGLDVTLLAASLPGPYLFPAPAPWSGGNVGIKLAAGITASLFYRVACTGD